MDVYLSKHRNVGSSQSGYEYLGKTKLITIIIGAITQFLEIPDRHLIVTMRNLSLFFGDYA
jgi:hypothetical protein